ncbi:MAG: hypothetical protein IPJ41_07220 [Phycisphaerales bacterium]|nr:hypothetical protein [Phycisphaerales bacterium]
MSHREPAAYTRRHFLSTGLRAGLGEHGAPRVPAAFGVRAADGVAGDGLDPGRR